MTKYQDKIDLLVDYLRKSECAPGDLPVFAAYHALLRLAERGLDPDEIDYIKQLKDLAEAEITPDGKTIEALGQDKADALTWCNMNEVLNKKE